MCQPNDLKREIKKKATGEPNKGPNKNLVGPWLSQAPCRIATGNSDSHLCKLAFSKIKKTNKKNVTIT